MGALFSSKEEGDFGKKWAQKLVKEDADFGEWEISEEEFGGGEGYSAPVMREGFKRDLRVEHGHAPWNRHRGGGYKKNKKRTYKKKKKRTKRTYKRSKKKSRRRYPLFGGSRPGGEGHVEYDKRIGCFRQGQSVKMNQDLLDSWHGTEIQDPLKEDQPLKVDQLTQAARDWIEQLRASHTKKNARCDWCRVSYDDDHDTRFKMRDICPSCREVGPPPTIFSAGRRRRRNSAPAVVHRPTNEAQIAKGKKASSKKPKKKRKTKKPKKR
jgi:hypothetical protein